MEKCTTPTDDIEQMKSLVMDFLTLQDYTSTSKHSNGCSSLPFTTHKPQVYYCPKISSKCEDWFKNPDSIGKLRSEGIKFKAVLVNDEE